jgi:RHS repeat-associated protein
MRKGLGGLIRWVGFIAVCSLALGCAPFVEAQGWSNGYSYRAAITVDHTKVPNTDQTNFPLLVSGTYGFLATTANGGGVSNSSGYDIVFTSDSAGTSLLPFEQESYSPINGSVNYWVQVPLLSHTADTVIYMFYGNSGISTDQSNKSGVWDSNFIGVWHLPNGTTLSANDSTSNGNNGVISGAAASTGKIGGGASFSGSGMITITPAGSLSGTFTVEAWAAPGTTTGSLGIYGSRTPSDQSFDAKITSSAICGDVGTGSSWLVTGACPSFAHLANAWHHVVWTVNTTGYQVYSDGAQIGSGTFSGTPLLFNSNHKLLIGATGYSGEGFVGTMDEVRVSNSVRSADWIATQYNNQSNPASFLQIVPNPPTISTLSPNVGAGGTSVTISGTNFGAAQGTSTVTLGGVACTVSSWSSTSVAITVPSAATTGNVVLTVGGVPSNGVSFRVPASWSNGYSFRRAIEIDHRKIPNTDQANFPLLISGTYAFLATTANGGGVTNSNGYDIIFTSDAAGTNILPFEREFYSPSNGAVSYWVQVPTLSHTADTLIYMFYGNGNITADPSNKTGVWDTNFKGVWHLANGSPLDATDSTSNSNNGASYGPVGSTGKIGGAASFSGSNQYIDVGNGTSLQITGSAITVEAWINTSESNPNQWKRILVKETPGNADPFIAYGFDRVANTNFVGFGVSHGAAGTNVTANSITPLVLGAWTHIVGTYDGSSVKVYLNGTLNAQAATSGAIGGTTQDVVIGADTANSSEYFNGLIDEARISNVARSADWIAAEYNNQNSPATFYSVGIADVNGWGAASSAPYISALAPAAAPITAPISILGVNFGPTQGSSTVTFNGTAATPAAWSDSAIQVPVPSGATSGNVVVTVSGVSSNPASFTVTLPPTAGYAFTRAITIDHTKVPNTDQQNFPLLISGTYPFLAAVSGGGGVLSSNGYDIVFTSDAGGVNLLPFERESYSAGTGAITYWVKVPTVSHTADTVIYMFYGNPAITTDQSNRTAVWDGNYKGVWHLGNGVALGTSDSTGNMNNGTASGNLGEAAGKINGAVVGYGGTNNGITMTSSVTADNSPFTYSFWVKSSGGGGTVQRGQDGFGNGWSANIWISSNFRFSIVNSSPSQINLSSNATVTNGTWYNIAAVWVPGSGMKLYVNGALDNSNTDSSTALRSSTKPLQFLNDNGNNGFTGLLDEVQISNVARSADWLGAEYNNQNSPATFYSVGAASVSGSGGTASPYIASLSPSSGPVTMPVSILGLNFGATQGTGTVTFNGAPATPTSWTDSSIYVPVPASATSGSVFVTVSGNPSNSASFTVTNAPGIWSLSPSSGMVGVQVTLTGINLGATQGSSTVTLNGLNCPVVNWNDTAIAVIVPSGATTGAFAVSVGGQTLNSPTFTVTQVPTSWLDRDIGQAGVAGTASYSNGTFTVQGAGTGTLATTADGMNFLYQPLSGDGTIVARVVTAAGSGNMEAGVMIRETLDPASSYADMVFYAGSNRANPPGGFTLAARTSTRAQSSGFDTTQPGVLTNQPPPYWVKLVRSGNIFTGYASPDGRNWSQVSVSQTIPMTQTVYVGLFVSNRTTAGLATATFDGVSLGTPAAPAPVITSVSATTGSIGSQVVINGANFGTAQASDAVFLNGLPMTINSWSSSSITATIPAGATSGYLAVSVAPSMNSSNPAWFAVTTQPLPPTVLDGDIGTGVGGGATYSGGLFDVYGGGRIASTSDTFHFVYQQLSGDGTVVARIPYLSNVNPVNYERAGVMIRETLDPASACAFLFYQPNQAYMYYRSATGANMAQQTVGLTTSSYPYWVKLTRSGNTFNGYISLDGVYWTPIGTSQTITMAQNVYIGLAVANGEGKFDNVSIGSSSSPAPVITNISGTTGAIGDQVVITGTGFGTAQNGSVVYLNGSPMTVNSWSSTSVTVTVPSGATTGYLTVAVALSMNNTNPVWFTVTPNPLPSGWLDRDVGYAGAFSQPGIATFSSGTFTMQASGQGIFTSADSMHFVYQSFTGDGTVVARVTNGYSREAGVMIRETLDPGALTAYACYFSSNQACFRTRSTNGASMLQQNTGFSGPGWVKVTRSGNVFSGYASADGVYWTQVGTSQTISMAQTVYVGMAFSNDYGLGVGGAAFDSSSLVQGTPYGTPSVTSISPTTAGVGYAVTVNGSGFGAAQGSSNVYFNGAPAASITSWSDTQVVATVSSAATSGPVTVVVNGIGSNRTVSLTVYKPVISSLTPPAASTGGTITITGSGFGVNQGSSTVQFNGVNSSVSSWSDTSLSATVPSSATTGPVTVTEGGIVSSGVLFTVLEPLAISSISPSSGSAGTPVTISGAGFGPTQSSSTVDFYGTPATITGWTDTQITALVPSGAPSGSVDVTVAGATAFGPSFLVNTIPGVVDSQGNTTRYTMGLIGGMWVPISSQGSGCSTCTLRGTIEFTYDNSGNVLTRTDELGRTTTNTYDTKNNVTSVSVPLGNGTNAVTSYTYNSFGEVLTTTDPLGNVTTNTYDANGNLLTVTTPPPNGSTAASVITFTYDSKGQLQTIKDPLNNVTTLTYTPAGLIQTVTDAQNNVTTYGYDGHGNRTSVADALNHTTTFAYDSGDRLQTITYPGSTGTTVFGYDNRGRRTSVTDQNGKATTYAYDDADRLTSVTDAANNVTSYGYDTENNLTSITDANQHTTTFAYDAFGRMSQTTFPSGGIETYSYDAVGNLTGKTDRKNQSITYTYDQLNRLAQKQYPDNSTVNYTYDNDSRLTQVTDPTGTYSFTFDNMGRLTGTTTQYAFLPSRTFTTAYSYDADSNRIGFTDPESGSTIYAYDTLNRLQTLTPPAAISGGSFGFGYDALSRRTSLTRPNAVNTTYGYDNLSRLLSVVHAKAGTSLDGATYTVDNPGNRTSKTDLQAGVTTSYGYDNIYQLLSATSGSTEGYTYDPVGNRLSSTGVPSYSYNNSNELTSNSNTTYGYDLNGNALTKNDSTGITTYGWDFENRLMSVTLPGSGGTVQFRYDPFGRRIYKSSTNGTSVFAYDGDNFVEETNASGSPLARYSQGLNIDEPLAMLRGGATNFYNADGLGSITSLADGSGSLAQTYTFDSFGKQIASSGSLTNPFQYTARESDPETGLYYYRARYYDPAVGRFLSEDPLRESGDGPNFYVYSFNDPVGYSDPSGMDAQPLPIFRGKGKLIPFPEPQFPWGRAFGRALGIVGAIAGELLNPEPTARDEDLLPKNKPDCDKGKACKPCDPPVGTLGYRVSGDSPHPRRPTHFDKPTQTKLSGARWHLYEVAQSPPSAGCKCWWFNLEQSGKYPPPPAGAVPITGPATGGGIQ